MLQIKLIYNQLIYKILKGFFEFLLIYFYIIIDLKITKIYNYVICNQKSSKSGKVCKHWSC